MAEEQFNSEVYRKVIKDFVNIDACQTKEELKKTASEAYAKVMTFLKENNIPVTVDSIEANKSKISGVLSKSKEDVISGGAKEEAKASNGNLIFIVLIIVAIIVVLK